MLARKVPNGAGEEKSRLPERHQPRSIASTAAPQYHPQSSSVANGTRTDKQGGRCRSAREMVCRNGLCAGLNYEPHHHSGPYFREGDEFKRLRGDPRFVAR